jgi:hypothetical protein
VIGATTDELLVVSGSQRRAGTASAHCRHCNADWPLPLTRTLSRHPTSGGVVTYFRCPARHTDFYIVGGS